MVLGAQSMGDPKGRAMKRALIISDGKPGHFNQSVAFCQHLGLDFETIEVTYKSKALKALSYLLDRLHIYSELIFQRSAFGDQWVAFGVVVSTGSTGFYPSKVLARKLGTQNVAILHPKGYRLDFTHIFCPAYDHPPKRSNITELPINLCASDESFFN